MIMKRLVMVAMACAFAAGDVVNGQNWVVTGNGDVEFDAMAFFPDGTLEFDGGGAVLTNYPGVYEFTGVSVNNWAGNLLQPLTFTGLKATPEWMNYPAGAFAVNTQYAYRGLWHVPASGTYSFAGTFDDGAYLAIDGVVLVEANGFNARSVTRDYYLAQGWHNLDLRCFNAGGSGGARADWGWPSGVVFGLGDIDFEDNNNAAQGQVFGAAGDVMASLDGVNYIFGRMLMTANGAMTVNEQLLGEPVFAGIVQSPDGMATLTLTDWSGPLLFGSPDLRWPAALDGNIANALILTNYAWLCYTPIMHAIAPGATLAFDGATPLGAAGGALTLDAYSLIMLMSTPNVAAVTVDAGRTLSFISRVYDDGAFSEVPTAFSTDIILNGGAAVFDGLRSMTFTGTFSGSDGAISKNGTNSLTLAGSGAGCAVPFQMNMGEVIVASAAALCDAPVHVVGSSARLSNAGNLTLSNPFTISSGTINAVADTVFEIIGPITALGANSKAGPGTLRLSGSGDNTNYQIHSRGGTLELNHSNGYAVHNIGDIEPGSTVRITGASGSQIADNGRVQLSGGTFDLNGHDETIGALMNTLAGSAVINNGNQPATLTVGTSDLSSTYRNGVLADGAETLALTKIGSGTLTLGGDALQLSGVTTVDGGTLCILPNDSVSAALIRLSLMAARPRPDGDVPDGTYYDSGIQFSEFQLTYKGVGMAWPLLEEMIVEGDGGSNTENAPNVLDGDTNTKWYFNQNTPLPNPLTITTPYPMVFDGYQLATGGDAIGRDPSAWTLEIGVVDGTATNWVQIDARADYDMPGGRRTYTPILDITVMDTSALRSWQPIVVNADGTLLLPGCISGQTLDALTGDGTLKLADDSLVTLTRPEIFSGTIDGSGTIAFNTTTNEITVSSISGGITLKNDGAPAALLSGFGGTTNMWPSSIQDGTAPLGLTQGAGTTYYTAKDSTYSGDTLLAGGEAFVASSIARYVRFTPITMRPGGSNGNGRTYQLSRFWLMQAGQVFPYPPGTTAYGTITSNPGGESVDNLLLDTLPVGRTKFYSDPANNAVVIVLPYTIPFDGYTWYTGDDSTGRDPITWTVEISLDGVTWLLADFREEEDITTDRDAMAGEWTLDALSSDFCAFSPNSRMTISAGAKLTIISANEPVGPLSGDGIIALSDGTLILNTFTDAVFDGAVDGDGTLVKQGAATQTFSGALSFVGDLIVEDGILNLDGVTLAGVTNIILRGGVLTGSASVGGDLTVTFEGGAYDAALAVNGTLAIVGDVLLQTPEALPYSKRLFAFGSIDVDSETALRGAQMSTPLSPGINVNIKIDGSSATLTISRGGTMILLK